jgi:enterochelin esterase family protein
MTEHSIPSAHLPAPRKAWIHRSTTGNAKDCLLFLDGELYAERVKAPAILREAEAAGALPPVTCVYLPNASSAGRHADYTCNAAFADFLAREMPPWIEREAGRIERGLLPNNLNDKTGEWGQRNSPVPIPLSIRLGRPEVTLRPTI